MYDRRLKPRRLTEAQVEEIRTKANAVRPDGRQTWFILVHMSGRDKDDGKPYYEVTVYFTPDAETPRIRKGRCAGFSSLWDPLDSSLNQILAELAKADPDRKDGKGNPCAKRLRDYWQVSLRGKPFDRRLAKPSGTLLPFDPPEGFTDQEIVEIIDFIRTNPRKPLPPNTHLLSFELDGAKPIYSVARKNGIIEVRTGAMQGLLAGAGQFIRLRRTPKGFEVIAIGFWVS